MVPAQETSAMIKVHYPIKYNGGSIYERGDGWGYRAVLHYGGVQHTKTNKDVSKLKVWIDRNVGIVREGKTPLTNSENIEYRAAMSLLPTGMSLIEAVKDYRRMKDAQESRARGKTFAAGVDIFLSECRVKKVREPTYYNYEKYLMRVGKAWGGLALPNITTEMVREMLALHAGKADTTQNQYHKLLTAFFNFAHKQKWISDSPISPVARVKIMPKRPKIYLLEEVRAIMYASQRVAPDTVPYYALKYFAGMRPETVRRYDWEYISETVFVPMELNKTPIDYEVPIRPNLAAWLALTPPQCRNGAICVARGEKSWDQLISDVEEASGVKTIQDGARRTFASCVCALEGTEKAVEQMGHRSPTMLYRHYRKLIGKEQAQAFFEIYPMGDAEGH